MMVAIDDTRSYSAGDLPDGTPIPEDFSQDAWYLLDDELHIIAATSQMLNEAGQSVQDSVLFGALWRNLTFGIETAASDPTIKFDLGYASQWLLDTRFPVDVARSEHTAADGRRTLLYSAREMNSTTYAEYTAVEERASFDAETGRLLAVERYGLSDLGEWQFIQSATYVVLERVPEPSAHVLDLLIAAGWQP